MAFEKYSDQNKYVSTQEVANNFFPIHAMSAGHFWTKQTIIFAPSMV